MEKGEIRPYPQPVPSAHKPVEEWPGSKASTISGEMYTRWGEKPVA